MSWCWAAGGRNLRRGQLSSTCRASWRITLPPQSLSTSQERTCNQAGNISVHSMDVHNWACASSLKCMDNCVWGGCVLFWGFLSNGAKNWHIFGYNHWFWVTSNQSAKSSLSKVSSTFPVWETVFKVWYYFSTTQNRQRGVSAFYVFVRCPNKPSSWVLPMLFLLTDLIIITINDTTWPTRQHISQTWVGV